MSLQYLEALKQIGASPSTKFVIPMEFANLAAGIAGLTGESFSNGANGRAKRGETAIPPAPAEEPSA